MIVAATEAARIVRSLQVDFPSGPSKMGSAFLAPKEGRLVTCAHVVLNDQGQRASRVIAKTAAGIDVPVKLVQVDAAHDLATLELLKPEAPSKCRVDLPEVGEQVIFAGQPQGVTKPSIFPGMVSALGKGLISQPKCDVVQIAGMINNGNSGGPLLDRDGLVLGVITAKYVPMLRAIDTLTQELEKIPQIPASVGLGDVDFAAFVNLTIKSMWQMAAVLRLVQVGTGWAVPAKFFSKVGGA